MPSSPSSSSSSWPLVGDVNWPLVTFPLISPFATPARTAPSPPTANLRTAPSSTLITGPITGIYKGSLIVAFLGYIVARVGFGVLAETPVGNVALSSAVHDAALPARLRAQPPPSPLRPLRLNSVP